MNTDEKLREYIKTEFVDSGFITVHQWRNFVDYLNIMIDKKLVLQKSQLKDVLKKRLKEFSNKHIKKIQTGTMNNLGTAGLPIDPYELNEEIDKIFSEVFNEI